MARSNPALIRNPHMVAVHALGRPDAPPPQTKWAEPADGWTGGHPGAAKLGPPGVPNTPSLTLGAGTLGAGSNLLVCWTGPVIDRVHGAAAGFNLRWSPSGSAGWTTVPGVVSPYILSGLPAGAAMDVQLQSVNPDGASEWSEVCTLATAAAGPYAPNAPATASVAPPADGTVTKLAVTWALPVNDSTHDPATRFDVRFGPTGGGTWTTVTGVSSPYVLTGLTGATAFDVQVRGTNAAASVGPWSATATGTTWGATIAQGNWVAAASQVAGSGVSPSGGVNLVAVAAPTAVTGAAFAWSSSASTMPATGLIGGGADGQPNGWGQWFNAPAAAGTYYLWLLGRNAGGTIGALVTAAITVAQSDHDG